MKTQHKIIATFVLVGLFAAGCAPKASDEKVGEMCKNYLKVTGISKTTVIKEEEDRITAEYDAKGKRMQGDLARDLKGQDDVYEGRIKSLETDEITLTEDEEKEGVTVEQKKEAFKTKYTEEYERNKKNLNEEFEKFFAKLAPQRDREIRLAKEFVSKRKITANEEMEKCLTKTKAEGVSESTADCRIQAKITPEYEACE